MFRQKLFRWGRAALVFSITVSLYSPLEANSSPPSSRSVAEGSAESLWDRAKGEYDSQRFRAALKILQRCPHLLTISDPANWYMKVRIQNLMSDCYQNLGQHNKAFQLANSSLNTLQLHHAVGPEPEDIDIAYKRVSRCYENLGNKTQAITYRQRGLDGALQNQHRTHYWIEEDRQALLSLYGNNDFNRELQLNKKIFFADKALKGIKPADLIEDLYPIADCYFREGERHFWGGKEKNFGSEKAKVYFTLALPWLKELLERQEKYQSVNSTDAFAIDETLVKMAKCLELLGQHKEALELSDRALVIRERVSRFDRTADEHRVALASSFVRLKMPSEAERIFSRFDEQSDDFAQGKAISQVDTDKGLEQLSAFYYQFKNLKLAESTLVKQLALREKMFGDLAMPTTLTRMRLAEVLGELHQPDKQLALFTSLSAKYAKASIEDRANTLNQLAWGYAKQERYSDAENVLRIELEQRLKQNPQQNTNLCITLQNLSALADKQSKTREAETLYKQLAHTATTRNLPAREKLIAYGALSSFYWRHHKLKEAAPWIQREQQQLARLPINALSDGEWYQRWFQYYGQKGDIREANAILSDPRMPHWAIDTGDVIDYYLANHNLVAAKRLLAARRLHSNGPGDSFLTGLVHEKSGELSQATVAFNQAVKYYRNQPVAVPAPDDPDPLFYTPTARLNPGDGLLQGRTGGRLEETTGECFETSLAFNGQYLCRNALRSEQNLGTLPPRPVEFDTLVSEALPEMPFESTARFVLARQPFLVPTKAAANFAQAHLKAITLLRAGKKADAAGLLTMASKHLKEDSAQQGNARLQSNP